MQFYNKSFVITGGESLSCTKIESIFSVIAQKNVKFVSISRENAKVMLEYEKKPQWMINMYLELYDQFNTSEITPIISPHFETILGKPPTTFFQFCSDYADVFREEYLRYCIFSIFLNIKKEKRILYFFNI